MVLGLDGMGSWRVKPNCKAAVLKTASSGASRVRVQVPHSPPWKVNWREIPNLTRNQWEPATARLEV